jgi:hypothetical protein
MTCPNCGLNSLEWYDGGEAHNYEAEHLVSCTNCGYMGERERGRDDDGEEENHVAETTSPLPSPFEVSDFKGVNQDERHTGR